MNKKAFTLIETLVGVAVMSLVAIAASSVAITAIGSFAKQNMRLLLIEEARWAIDFMSDELRHAEGSTMDDRSSGNSLVFQVDTDYDGTMADEWWYRYRRSSQGFFFATVWTNQIYRQPGFSSWGVWWGPTSDQVIYTIIDNPDLDGVGGTEDIFDESGGYVTIELTVRPDPTPTVLSGKLNRPITFRTSVRARN